MDYQLDDTDRKIIGALCRDGRMSIAKLAIETGIKRATAYARFVKLQQLGVIDGFTARINAEISGTTVAALIFVNVNQGDWRDVTSNLCRVTGVEWIGFAAGVFDFIILVRTANLEELRDVVLKELQDIEGIRSTQTSLLLNEMSPRAGLTSFSSPLF